MADKAFPLSIIIRTVDKATAGIQAINHQLDEITRPSRELGKALKELGEKSGFNRVSEGFHEVGKAGKEVLWKLLEGAAIIGETTHLVLEMVESFAALHDKADQLGTTADFLAGIEYAASKSGASVEILDQGLRTLVENMGAAKAGTGGKVMKFLEEISPVFARQFKSANSVEVELGLLAAAAAKLPDAARRAKLAAATLGDPKLAPLLARGTSGIQELLVEYHRLAGAQGEAAEAAAKTDDALKELHASTDGVKAALVTGLAPALTTIIGQLSEWLSGHRAEVQQWAEDIGKKLPGAVDEIVKTIKGAIKWVADFVKEIGGWKVAALGVAAVIAGPLIASVAALGVALLATPFGQVLLALTPIVAAIASLVSETEAFEAVAQRLGFAPKKKTEEQDFKERQDAMMEDGRRAAKAEAAAKADLDADPVVQKSRLLADQHDAMLAFPSAREIAMEQLRTRIDQRDALTSIPQEAKIKIDITGAPKGTRVTADPSNTAHVDLTTGYQVMGFGT